MSRWSRPRSVPIPTVWAEFEGKIGTNGTRKSYWIQDITDDYKDEVVKYMTDGFLAEEPLSMSLKAYENPDIVNKYRKLWYKAVDDNLGLLCLTRDENGKPTIAGINCTTLCSQLDENIHPEELDTILQMFFWVKHQINPFTKFNITEYLDGMGLFVLPEYRGEGIGLELLKSREALSRACGLKASLTIFSSKFSQRCAEIAGFKDLYAIDYDKLEKINPMYKFPGIQEHTKSFRFMYIEYE